MKGFILGVGTTLAILLTLSIAVANVTNNGDGTWTFGYTVSATQAVELRDALCHNGGYQETVFDDELGLITNPQSCQEFAWERGEQFFVQEVKAYRTWQAEQAISIGEDIQVD